MDDLVASLTVGMRVRIHDAPCICISRFTFDRRDKMLVFHNLRLPLDHPASLITVLERELFDLHRLGCIRIETGRGVPPQGPNGSSRIRRGRAQGGSSVRSSLRRPLAIAALRREPGGN